MRRVLSLFEASPHVFAALKSRIGQKYKEAQVYGLCFQEARVCQCEWAQCQ
ncbi:hypothetical protein KIN20_015449 [Parelaphostrongylus tenuis]|uniref:Uncharacterized protein n=1 Tax=Parelaphostrongylus tenuis TaxID=148309 RepID=A0AAD5MYG9_PARTN|nr:hypothetical protein KIN20_015449 [Parelaphostrongylus tenuis]